MVDKKSFRQRDDLSDLLAEKLVIGSKWTTERRSALRKWKYLSNYTNMEELPSIWTFGFGDTLCGQLGAILVSFKVFDEEFVCGWLADFGIVPKWQRQGLGIKLVQAAFDELGFILGYGLSSASYNLFIKLGWTYLGEVPLYRRVLRPYISYRPRALLDLIYWSLVNKYKPPRFSTDTVKIIERFDKRADAVWKQMAKEITCAAKRDQTYLNWRYVDVPGCDYILLASIMGDEHKGYIVICKRGYVGHIVDFIVPPSDSLTIKLLIDTTIRFFYRNGFREVTCGASDARIQNILRSYCFRRRGFGRRFLYWNDSKRVMIRSKLQDWFLTSGDCDLDLPNP